MYYLFIFILRRNLIFIPSVWQNILLKYNNIVSKTKNDVKTNKLNTSTIIYYVM